MKLPDNSAAADLLARLTERVRFPTHGWTEDREGTLYLILPILGAFGDLMENPPHGMKGRDYLQMDYFRRLFMRILTILNRVARAEATILKGVESDVPIEVAVPYFEAGELLPIWIEVFYVFFRVLADRLAYSLGWIASGNPLSFPRHYKAILAEASSGRIPDWGWIVDPKPFLDAIAQNSQWFDLLTAPSGGGRGIRDSILHRMVEPGIITEVNAVGQATRVEVRFGTVEKDVPNVDLLNGIRDVVHSFNACLSALPVELWRPREFQMSDLWFRADFPGIRRFFPKIAE